MKKIKIKGIIFEGIDGAGKTTIMNKFNCITGKKWLCVDRSIGSCIVYGKHRGRFIDYNRCYETDKSLAHSGFIIVFVDANDKDIIKRNKIKNDGDITSNDILNLRHQYDDYLKKTCMRVIKIHTSCVSVEMSVLCLLKSLDDLGENYYENN